MDRIKAYAAEHRCLSRCEITVMTGQDCAMFVTSSVADGNLAAWISPAYQNACAAQEGP